MQCVPEWYWQPILPPLLLSLLLENFGSVVVDFVTERWNTALERKVDSALAPRMVLRLPECQRFNRLRARNELCYLVVYATPLHIAVVGYLTLFGNLCKTS